MTSKAARTLAAAILLACISSNSAVAEQKSVSFRVTVDRGPDVGQSFGSLFEARSEDGTLTIGAGFPNAYNTRYRADRHSVQFYIRPRDGVRSFAVERLPRPNELCGTYLAERDGRVYSTYGGLRRWDPAERAWLEVADVGGTQETMRVGHGLLEFGDSTVRYNGRPILERPDRGSYQLFFYANGHLCFYHVDRGDGPYRPYKNDSDGFSKLVACPWTPEQHEADLSQAIVRTLPVVGETTFAWGQLDSQIVTGSNIGGFYVFEGGRWRMLLEPRLGVSYQLYSSLSFGDRLLMGQYPTGRLFAYDGQAITDQAGWPPVPPGVSGGAREAQTTVLYGGELLVGVWPWGELWRYHPGSEQWSLMQRMFDHPRTTSEVVHPYDVENQGNAIGNLWGQRVTSLVPCGSDLFVATSAKTPCEWDAKQYPFLAPDKWKSYGAVYRLTMPGHLTASTTWTDGPTQLEFAIGGGRMSIRQDGKLIAESTVSGPLASQLRQLRKLEPVRWGRGIYGRFAGTMDGTATQTPNDE